MLRPLYRPVGPNTQWLRGEAVGRPRRLFHASAALRVVFPIIGLALMDSSSLRPQATCRRRIDRAIDTKLLTSRGRDSGAEKGRWRFEQKRPATANRGGWAERRSPAAPTV